MTRNEYKRLGRVIAKVRRDWQGFPEAQAGIDQVITDLAREYALKNGHSSSFRVASWLDWCGVALVMPFLGASIARERFERLERDRLKQSVTKRDLQSGD